MSRTIVVTGSASGIGAATAALLRERGDRVIGVDLREAEVCADLSSPAGRDAASSAVFAQVGDGALDGLVTCAGLSRAGAPQVSVNYFGTVDLVRPCWPAHGRHAWPSSAPSPRPSPPTRRSSRPACRGRSRPRSRPPRRQSSAAVCTRSTPRRRPR
ncbi:SDR family NAD(P)-dependent oxidoreductase [Nocardioides faecalis]|nr:SDR family NAD(P)-dependent oxidoreductase [Nocardioides faecalis]